MISRKTIAIILPIILLIGIGVCIYSLRVTKIDISTYVPDSALGYIEINDWPSWVENFSSTEYWKSLTPVYGLDEKLKGLGNVGLAKLLPFWGGSEAAVLARSQLAIVLTGIEIRDEVAKPHFALIVETHSSESDLKAIIDKRLKELARSTYGKEISKVSTYNGVDVISYTGDDPSRQIHSAQIKSEWILSNNHDSIRACIDTKIGKRTSIANNEYLKTARSNPDFSHDTFGFVTRDGIARLMKFATFLMSRKVFGEKALGEGLQDILAEIASTSSDGFAWSARFNNGMVTEHSQLMLKPDLAEKLKSSLTIKKSQIQSTAVIPSDAQDVTIFDVGNPDKALKGIATALSSKLGAVPSFILTQFIIGIRESFFGLKPTDNSDQIFGNEFAGFVFDRDSQDRVWLIEVKDKNLTVSMIKKYLNASDQPNSLIRENYKGVEITRSATDDKNATAFLDNFLVIGKRPLITKTIDSFVQSTAFKSSNHYPADLPNDSAVFSFSSIIDDTDKMMIALAGKFKGGAISNSQKSAVLSQLPFSAGFTRLNELGIYSESKSVFGSLPFFMSFFDAKESRSEAAKK